MPTHGRAAARSRTRKGWFLESRRQIQTSLLEPEGIEEKSQPGPSGVASDRGAGIGCVTTGLTTVNRPPIASQGKHEEGRSQPLKCGKVQNHAALTDVGQHGPTWCYPDYNVPSAGVLEKNHVRDRNRPGPERLARARSAGRQDEARCHLGHGTGMIRARARESGSKPAGRAQAKGGRSTMMRTRNGAAAVLALAIIGGDADVVGADAPPLRPAARPGRTVDRARRAGSARGDARQQSLLDQLDDARINRDLLEMEVAADKMQIEKMMTVLRDTELTPIQGFSLGPVIGGSDQEERAANLEKYKTQARSRLCRFRDQEQGAEPGTAARGRSSKPSLASQRRPRRPPTRPLRLRVRRARWPMPSGSSTSFSAGSKPGSVPIRRRPTNGPHPRRSSPSPTPEDRPLKDAERFLDLLRRGIESWRRDPSAPPEERPVPEERPRPEVGARSKLAQGRRDGFSTCFAAGLKAGKAA